MIEQQLPLDCKSNMGNQATNQGLHFSSLSDFHDDNSD